MARTTLQQKFAAAKRLRAKAKARGKEMSLKESLKLIEAGSKKKASIERDRAKKARK